MTDRGKVVLSGHDRTAHALLVLPLDRVHSDLATRVALMYSRTFAVVRADAGAAALLDTS